MWSQDQIASLFPKTFMTLLKKWRFEEWVQHEMSLMPATQEKMHYLEKYSRVKKHIHFLDQEIRQMMRQVREIKLHRSLAYLDLDALKNEWAHNVSNSHGSRPCPNTNCRGYLNTEWICTLCKSQTCLTCLCEKSPSEKHVCQKENQDSAQLILQKTKSCPKCGIPIMKSEGCDQVWCVHCHTAFNWHTHKIIIFTHSFHNPHYSEWYNKTMHNKNMLDKNIDVLLPIFHDKYLKLLQEAFPRTLDNTPKMMKLKNGLIPLIDNLKNILRNHSDQPNIYNDITRNESLRIEYLKNDIDENTFISKLKRRMKSQLIHQEKSQQMLTFVQQQKQKIYDFYQHVYTIVQELPKKRSRSEVLQEQMEALDVLYKRGSEILSWEIINHIHP